MKRFSIAVAAMLAVMPAIGLAQDTSAAAPGAPARPAMSSSQRQALFKTFTAYRQKDMALRKQFRAQVLAALSPSHRAAVGNAIGAMAVSASPDPAATAKQIDGLLSSGEQQAVMSASQTFADQRRALADQMRAQVRSELPSPPPNAPNHAGMRAHAPAPSTDAGTVLLTMLGRSERPMMGPGMGRMGPGGPPPGEPPMGGPPPGSPDGNPPPR